MDHGPCLATNEHARRAVDAILSQSKAPIEIFNSRSVPWLNSCSKLSFIAKQRFFFQKVAFLSNVPKIITKSCRNQFKNADLSTSAQSLTSSTQSQLYGKSDCATSTQCFLLSRMKVAPTIMKLQNSLSKYVFSSHSTPPKLL